MNDWTRRQFGLWTSAALLIPGVAVAGDPGPQGQAVLAPAPDGKAVLPGLAVKAAWKSADETSVTWELTAIWKGDKPLKAQFFTGDATLVDAKGETGSAITWLDDEHPFSRRVMAPRFVDVPAGATLVVAELHVHLNEKPAPGTSLQTSLSVSVGKRTYQVALDPLPLARPELEG